MLTPSEASEHVFVPPPLLLLCFPAAFPLRGRQHVQPDYTVANSHVDSEKWLPCLLLRGLVEDFLVVELAQENW